MTMQILACCFCHIFFVRGDMSCGSNGCQLSGSGSLYIKSPMRLKGGDHRHELCHRTNEPEQTSARSSANGRTEHVVGVFHVTVSDDL